MTTTLECTNIEIEQIRARIVINDVFTVETPYVKSFSVNKARASNVGTFSVSIEVPSNTQFGTPTGTSGRIKIYAGTKQNYISKGPIFTGIIRTMAPTPVVGKPNYFNISMSGNDIMYRLQNKKFSRRIPTNGPGLFVTIGGSVGTRPTSMVWSIDKKVRSGKHTYTKDSPDLDDKKEHNTITKLPERAAKDGEWYSNKGIEPVPEPTGGQGSGLTVHDHSVLNKGGPAFGTYAVS